MYYFNWRGFRMLIESHPKPLDKISIDLQVSVQSVYGWKSGRHKPSLNQLAKISDYFKVRKDDLMCKPEDFKITQEDIEETNKGAKDGKVDKPSD